MRVEPLGQQLVACRLDRGAPPRVGLVGERDRHAAIRDRGRVDRDLERRLELGELGGLALVRLPEVALEREREQVADPPCLLATGRPRHVAEVLDGVAREQLRVALVDRLDLELALAAGEVEVVLAVDLLGELLGRAAVAVEVQGHDAATIGGWRPRSSASGRARETSSSSTSRGWRSAGAESRASNGYVVFVAGALPGDRVRARADQGQARLRGGARGRARAAERRAGPRPLPARRRAVPGRPVAGAAVRAPARAQAAAGRRRARADRRPRRVRARADRARRRGVALPQQARVLVRGATTTGSCSASTPAAAGTWW